ncbi:hypothetical protein O6H91_07G072000 [Diphasiastrum complanatum]|uniref:Uncharacterized protein n=1 Tax=Diphasiastrum complanatum TaxID=34168 RepID=A0ACC2D6G3_DIPCM|nr:hypothetical protein O6H91_07G072000 [Diphasiastrum complanatum]
MARAAAAASEALKTLPGEAVPGMLEVLLQATGTPPSILLSHLLEIFKENYEADSWSKTNNEVDWQYIGGFSDAMHYLLKFTDSDLSYLDKVIWTVWVPLLQVANMKEIALCFQVTQSVAEVVADRNAWACVQFSLLPLCLASLRTCLTLKDETINCDWNCNGPLCMEMEKVNSQEAGRNCEQTLPVSAVCQLLATLLTKALDISELFESDQLNSKREVKEETFPLERHFCQVAVSLFWHPALLMLSQSLDRSIRRIAIETFLPPLLRAANKLEESELQARFAFYDIYNLRPSPSEEVWMCCKSLFSQHCFERRDAYMALTLLKSFLIPAVTEPRKISTISDAKQRFDVRNDAAFWDELKAGLVDEDPLTRKRAMHVLKMALHKPGSQSEYNLKENTQKSSVLGLKDKQAINDSTTKSLRKRERLEKQEAASLGIGTFPGEEAEINDETQWTSFWHLYEILEEYGIHLVEAAWKHQMSKLMGFVVKRAEESNVLMKDVNVVWTTVLWDRGFKHGNPQVRRLVLQSFLELDWESILNVSTIVPEEFVLGPLMLALNDPANHKDFGLNESYESQTSKSAAKFIALYSSSLQQRSHANFVTLLAKSAISLSPCRAGFMTLVSCIQAAAIRSSSEKDWSLQTTHVLVTDELLSSTQSTELLEALRLVVEECKCHYNPKYRAKVYSHVLTAASVLVIFTDISISKFGHFLTTIPRELLAENGPLHERLRCWLKADCFLLKDQFNPRTWVVDGLNTLIIAYFKSHNCHSASYEMSEEEFDSWRLDSERWASLLVIGSLEEHQQMQLLQLVQHNAAEIDKRAYICACIPVKILFLVSSLLKECKECSLATFFHTADDTESTIEQMRMKTFADGTSKADPPSLTVQVAKLLGSIMIELVSYASRATAVFWEYDHVGPLDLPLSVTGKLGGPSQRRLPASTTSAVLKAVLAVTTIAHCTVWLHYFHQKSILQFTTSFLWSFAWKVVTTQKIQLEMGAEIQLGAFEALASVCNALAVTASPSTVGGFIASGQFEVKGSSSTPITCATIVDSLVRSLVVEMNSLLSTGELARSRIAVLVHHKWCCLDSLLSIASNSVCEESKLGRMKFVDTCAISDSTMQEIFKDAINSLEHAGEETLLHILRSVRWLLHWKVLELIGNLDDAENRKRMVVWALVRSGWTALSNSNKRKVALIAAFLSALLHPSFFAESDMHRPRDNVDIGPLKWLIGRLMEQGLRSPRTMRLTALHLTGLWLEYPAIACLYISELKSLSLHGGESVDEELDGEIAESKIAAREYYTLMKSSDPELTEAFTNTEMYVRITVAVMMHKLGEKLLDAQTSPDKNSYRAVQHALNCGQNLLVELLTATANDEDLSKELYKKKSAIHRRKVRAWQMLCILSHFVNDCTISRVVPMLELCLYRNNMASVRQYIEIFAVQVYLRIPSLVYDHLIPLLGDYNLKTQALSSYVSIASNVLMHISPMEVQQDMLKVIVPAIFPYITTHHHNLRSFSQVIIHEVLNRFAITKPYFRESYEGSLNLEQKCLQSMGAYLEGNSDCTRIRTSVEKFLNVLDPLATATPRGIFCNQFGEADPTTTSKIPFECAPTSMLDQIGQFLNEARDGLRESMTADSLTLSAQEYAECSKLTQHQLFMKNGCIPDGYNDFQLKQANSVVTDEYHFMHTCSDFQRKMKPFNDKMLCGDYGDEDDFLLRTVEARMKDLMKAQSKRQKLIVVASLLERIPNLAGLARTCEVFRVASLAIADKKILDDKQFQMISVTAEQWVPIVQVPEAGLEQFLQHKKNEGYLLLGLEQTANSIPVSEYPFPERVILLLGREKDGIPVGLIQALDACIEIPQLGVIRSLNVHVSGALAIWEYTKYHQFKAVK